MAGAKKRRQKHQNKTKARLIEELEALQREVARQKRGAGGKGVGAANSLLESEEFSRPSSTIRRRLFSCATSRPLQQQNPVVVGVGNPVMKAGGLGNA